MHCIGDCWILSEQTLNKRLQTSPETNFRWTSVIIQNQRRGKFEESGLRKVPLKEEMDQIVSSQSSSADELTILLSESKILKT